MLRMRLAVMPVLCLVLVLGCNSTPKSPDVTSDLNRSLDQAGLKGVSVSQDRDKGVVVLKGEVASDAEKAQAETIAKGVAAGQVVANEIGVRPPADTVAGEVDSSLDKGIKNNLDAKLTEAEGRCNLTGSTHARRRSRQVRPECEAGRQRIANKRPEGDHHPLTWVFSPGRRENARDRRVVTLARVADRPLGTDLD